jgi:hypothetical protein
MDYPNLRSYLLWAPRTATRWPGSTAWPSWTIQGKPVWGKWTNRDWDWTGIVCHHNLQLKQSMLMSLTSLTSLLLLKTFSKTIVVWSWNCSWLIEGFYSDYSCLTLTLTSLIVLIWPTLCFIAEAGKITTCTFKWLTIWFQLI